MWNTELKPWQLDLIVRLETGLRRPLHETDVACLAWDSVRETLSVVGRPLLGELRANNLTSNVFRNWNAGHQQSSKS